MKKINLLCVLALLSSQVSAERTPVGTTPTYTNENGGFTYYNLDGTPIAPGTRLFISGIGTANLLDDQGRTIATAFETPGQAEAARNAQPDCSGAVFGAGPGGDPCKGGSAGGASASGTIVEIDENVYNEKVFELNAVLYGATEIGAKSCKPAGDKMPGSLDSWFSAVKKYSLGETTRDKLLNSRIDAIQKKVTALTTGANASQELQIEAIQLQIDSVSASIESIGGTAGRIPLREAIILAALESTKSNVEENIKTVTAFKDMVDVSFIASTNAAKAACDRKKKVEKCEVTAATETEAEATTCHTELVADPVPGCDVALAQIPVMRAGPAQAYGEVYLSKIASTPENDMMKNYEDQMTSIMEGIPKSNDAEYDWSSPMEGGLAKMKIARKASGAKCPEGPKDPKDTNTKELNLTASEVMSKAAASFLEKIGVAENSKETAAAFTGAWGAADKVVGQAAYRAEYYDMAKEKANAVLAIDKQKLSNLQITKAKLEKYLKDINNMLASKSPAAKASTASGAAATATKSAANTLALAKTSGQVANAGASNAIKIGSASKEDQIKAIALDPNKNILTGVSGATGSVSTFATKSLSGADVSGLNLSAQSMALAKKSLDSIAAGQKKLNTVLATSVKSEAATPSKNKTTTKEDNTDKLTQLFEAMAKNGRGGMGGANSLTASTDKALDVVKDSPNAVEIYKSASAGGSKYYDAVNGYSGSKTSSSSPSRRFYEKDLGHVGSSAKANESSKTSVGGRFPASTPSSPAPTTGVERSVASTHDAEVLSDSIVARKAKNKDAYVSTDDDSLFERVTKAYIRNYEKVEDVPPAK